MFFYSHEGCNVPSVPGQIAGAFYSISGIDERAGPRDSLCCELPHQDFHCTSPPYWNIPFIYLLIQSITSCSCGLVSLHKDLLAPYPHWTDGRVVWDFWKMFSILTARLFECPEHMGVALGPGFSYHPLPLLVCAVHAFMLSRPLIQWHFFFCCP